MSNNVASPPPPKSVSVFFPAFNDAQSIVKLTEDALEILPRLADDYEVIVINDGSTDETKGVLNHLAAKYERMRVVHHKTNMGYGAALRSGFKEAKKDLVFYTDGDAQYDVRELPKLFPLLTDDVDVVNGYKIKRGDNVSRKVVGGFYNRLAHLLFPLPIRDVDCDFRLMRRETLNKLNLVSDSGSICVELVYKLKRAGADFREIGVNHYDRPFGRSQFFTFKRVSKTLFDFLVLWFKLVILRRK
jgi:glycosyltransferase involved in cell wall biosynthesis